MEWYETATGIMSLIINLIGLLGTAIGAILAVKGWLKAAKERKASENWSLIMSMADAGMKEAEASSLKGNDKKQMVIDIVKAACAAGGIDLAGMLDRLNAYIDQSITFVNGMTKHEQN